MPWIIITDYAHFTCYQNTGTAYYMYHIEERSVGLDRKEQCHRQNREVVYRAVLSGGPEGPRPPIFLRFNVLPFSREPG